MHGSSEKSGVSPWPRYGWDRPTVSQLPAAVRYKGERLPAFEPSRTRADRPAVFGFSGGALVTLEHGPGGWRVRLVDPEGIPCLGGAVVAETGREVTLRKALSWFQAEAC